MRLSNSDSESVKNHLLFQVFTASYNEKTSVNLALGLQSNGRDGGFMKTSILLSILFTVFAALFTAATANATVTKAEAAKSYSFQFKAPQSKPFSITQKANSREVAFKLAATECFRKLTGDKYPGEEKGLEIIDICANPKM